MSEHAIAQASARGFTLAGKALFTVQNASTGNRFTFKVKKHDEREMWFVKVLTGPDNGADYRYIGMITEQGTFTRTRNSAFSEDAQCFKVFKWFWANINNLPENVQVYHEGRCGRCGRRLTVPESILSGFGPECINHI